MAYIRSRNKSRIYVICYIYFSKHKYIKFVSNLYILVSGYFLK